MDICFESLPLDAQKALARYAAYGWRPAVAAKVLNCRFSLSLTSRDVAEIYAALKNEGGDISPNTEGTSAD